MQNVRVEKTNDLAPRTSEFSVTFQGMNKNLKSIFHAVICLFYSFLLLFY